MRIALETIRRRVAEGISAADILPMLGGSRISAEKRFRLATGKSILEEILDVRFEKLLSLLEQSHLPLGSLAGLAGFSSDNHLQRLFKARFGMTLTDYRRKTKAPVQTTHVRTAMGSASRIPLLHHSHSANSPPPGKLWARSHRIVITTPSRA